MKLSILDVGARGGAKSIFPKFLDSTRHLKCLRAGLYDIIGIEPDGQAFEKLNRDRNYRRVLKTALYNSNGHSILYITKSPDCSSLLRANTDAVQKYIDKEWWPNFEIVDEVEIQTKTLDKIQQEEELIVDFLKIDVQGVEYEIVEGGFHCISSSLAIVAELCETPWYINQKNMDQFSELVARFGFYPIASNYKPHISIEKDVLYIKSFDSITTRADLIKLVLILYIFGLDTEIVELVTSGRKRKLISDFEKFLLRKFTFFHLKYLAS